MSHKYLLKDLKTKDRFRVCFALFCFLLVPLVSIDEGEHHGEGLFTHFRLSLVSISSSSSSNCNCLMRLGHSHSYEFKYFATCKLAVTGCKSTEFAACLGKLTETAAKHQMSGKLVKWSI